MVGQIIYKKNFLTNVIFKINFPAISDFSQQKAKDLFELLRSEFSLFEEADGLKVEHRVEGDKISLEQIKLKKWLFRNKGKEQIIGFEQDSLTIEFLKYKELSELQHVSELVLTSLFKVVPELVSTRVGLRYVNQFTLPGNPLDLEGYFDSKLLSSMSITSDTSKLMRNMTLVELKRDEISTLRFQYGIANSDYPSRILKNEFVLDFDCSTDEGYGDAMSILKVLSSFNATITELFESSIGEKLRAEMRDGI